MAGLAFVDVGQGDCTILFDVDQGEFAILDCPSHGVSNASITWRDIAGNERPKFFGITHWDVDHWSGLPAILDKLRPAAVMYNIGSLQLHRMLPDGSVEQTKANAALRALLRRAKNREVDVGRLDEGDTGTIGGASWKVLAPSQLEQSQASVVIRVEIGEVVAIIGADAPESVWRRLTADGPLEVAVWRTPHHGSLSTMRSRRALAHAEVTELLSRPKVVVNSVGRAGERYGHPNPEGIVAAVASDARLMCTGVTSACADGLPDEGLPCAGTVTIRVGQGGITVTPSAEEHAAIVDGWSHPCCRNPYCGGA
jgi:beta-lactamase superfamily II metal-dependent hydrolase